MILTEDVLSACQLLKRSHLYILIGKLNKTKKAFGDFGNFFCMQHKYLRYASGICCMLHILKVICLQCVRIELFVFFLILS